MRDRRTVLPLGAPHPAGSYSLLPFRFHRMPTGEEVLVTDCGEWTIEPAGTVGRIVAGEVEPRTALGRRLQARQMISKGPEAVLDAVATKLRTKKRHLADFTSLHMFVATLRCEHSCHYCQVSRRSSDKLAFDMSTETADRAVDLVLRAPSATPKIEFQGGEPFLAFDVIKFVVEKARTRAQRLGKAPSFVVATNLAVVTDDMLRYCRDENLQISTSVDGPAWLHNANRPRPGGDSHERTLRGIDRARKFVGEQNVSALMTTTRLSLEHPEVIIDEYVRLGFRSIFLRSISPYGFALRTKRRTGYATDEFLHFFKRGLAYILELNRCGTILEEVFTKILLTKLLTPFATGFVDLESPSGAGISACIYNYDGDVYASDESRMLAEMGDKSFRLGNVHRDSYDDIFLGDRMLSLVENGTAEGLAGCSTCGLQPFCGADPVFHRATQLDEIGHRPTSDFCKRNMALVEHVIELVTGADRELSRIFWSWLREATPDEVAAGAPS